MKWKIWAARSNSPYESWAIQDATGKIQVVAQLIIRVPLFFPKQELNSTPKAWAEAEGALTFSGNGTAVIE